MCGRFNLTIPDFEQLAKLLGVHYDAQLGARYRPRYNVPPSDQHWIVAEPANDTRAILPARWGFGVKKLPLARGEAHRQEQGSHPHGHARPSSADLPLHYSLPTDGRPLPAPSGSAGTYGETKSLGSPG